MSDDAVLTIRREADGTTVVHPRKWDWDGDFIWEDGNFSCDCNRSIFFAAATGNPDDEIDGCGDGAFAVKLTDAGGKALYSDGSFSAEKPQS